MFEFNFYSFQVLNAFVALFQLAFETGDAAVHRSSPGGIVLIPAFPNRFERGLM